jgi:uncharacterized protein
VFVQFEFNPDKSAGNKLKHGIDFEEAQELWNVPGLVASSDRGDEMRFVRIVLDAKGRYWTAAFTVRNQNIRIISVRRSRKNEEEAYEREISGG